MPIKFIAGNTPTHTVNATVEVDDDGDLTLLLNGIRVLYIDGGDGGSINRFDIAPADAQRLEYAGINVDGGLLRDEG